MNIELFFFLSIFVGLAGICFGCSIARILEKGLLRKEQDRYAVLYSKHQALKRKYIALKELYEGSGNGT